MLPIYSQTTRGHSRFEKHCSGENARIVASADHWHALKPIEHTLNSMMGFLSIKEDFLTAFPCTIYKFAAIPIIYVKCSLLVLENPRLKHRVHFSSHPVITDESAPLSLPGFAAVNHKQKDMQYVQKMKNKWMQKMGMRNNTILQAHFRLQIMF